MLGACYKGSFWDQILAGLAYQDKASDRSAAEGRHFKMLILVTVTGGIGRNGR